MAAFRVGARLNPYPSGTDEASAWFAGWTHAFETDWQARRNNELARQEASLARAGWWQLMD
jgi:hypothetical protein